MGRHFLPTQSHDAQWLPRLMLEGKRGPLRDHPLEPLWYLSYNAPFRTYVVQHLTMVVCVNGKAAAASAAPSTAAATAAATATAPSTAPATAPATAATATAAATAAIAINS